MGITLGSLRRDANKASQPRSHTPSFAPRWLGGQRQRDLQGQSRVHLTGPPAARSGADQVAASSSAAATSAAGGAARDGDIESQDQRNVDNNGCCSIHGCCRCCSNSRRPTCTDLCSCFCEFWKGFCWFVCSLCWICHTLWFSGFTYEYYRIEQLFKVHAGDSDFKIADCALMKEQELLQQSAGILFGAGVIANLLPGSAAATPAAAPASWAAIVRSNMFGFVLVLLLIAVMASYLTRTGIFLMFDMVRDCLKQLEKQSPLLASPVVSMYLSRDPVTMDGITLASSQYMRPEGLESNTTMLMSRFSSSFSSFGVKEGATSSSDSSRDSTLACTDWSTEVKGYKQRWRTAVEISAQQYMQHGNQTRHLDQILSHLVTDEKAWAAFKAKVELKVFWDTMSKTLIYFIGTIFVLVAIAKVGFFGGLLLWLGAILYAWYTIIGIGSAGTALLATGASAAGILLIFLFAILSAAREMYEQYHDCKYICCCQGSEPTVLFSEPPWPVPDMDRNATDA